MLGLDDAGHLVGVEVGQASKVVNWSRLELGALPLHRAGPPSDQLDDHSGAGQQEGAD